MTVFKKKCDEVSELFVEFTQSVGECLGHALLAVEEYIRNGENGTVKDLALKTHQEESRADKYRRDIVDRLVRGAFMPATRKDLMNLVENIDNVADQAEELLDDILFIGEDISFFDKEGIRSMSGLLQKQFDILDESVQLLFKDMFQAALKTSTLQKIEAEVDKKEEEIMKKIRAEQKNLAVKMFSQKTVKAISDIADVIENAGDDISIIAAVKRG